MQNTHTGLTQEMEDLDLSEDSVKIQLIDKQLEDNNRTSDVTLRSLCNVSPNKECGTPPCNLKRDNARFSPSDESFEPNTKRLFEYFWTFEPKSKKLFCAS